MGCQVAEKARQLGMNAKNRLRRHGRGGGSAAAFFWKLNSPQVERYQALALLSTARSERSA